MNYQVRITIALKAGMLDPEAQAIRQALENIGFETESLKIARQFIVKFDAGDGADAERKAAAMCERILANPVIHTYTVEVLE